MYELESQDDMPLGVNSPVSLVLEANVKPSVKPSVEGGGSPDAWELSKILRAAAAAGMDVVSAATAAKAAAGGEGGGIALPLAALPVVECGTVAGQGGVGGVDADGVGQGRDAIGGGGGGGGAAVLLSMVAGAARRSTLTLGSRRASVAPSTGPSRRQSMIVPMTNDEAAGGAGGAASRRRASLPGGLIGCDETFSLYTGSELGMGAGGGSAMDDAIQRMLVSGGSGGPGGGVSLQTQAGLPCAVITPDVTPDGTAFEGAHAVMADSSSWREALGREREARHLIKVRGQRLVHS